MSDQLVKTARFRPQVTSRLKQLRENTINQIKKTAEQEKAEEHNVDRERVKKHKRDRELAALDAKGQRKYLEKEREREARKMKKKTTVRP